MKKIVKMIYILAIFFIVSTVLAALFGQGGLRTTNDIQRISIKGVVTMNSGTSTFLQRTVSAEEIIKRLDASEKSSNIKAIIIEINSRGGSVVGSKQIAEKIYELEKPVIVLIEEAALSGAYWIASAADYVISDDLSFVGGIGVIGSYLEFSEFIEDYNVNYQRLVSSEYKDIGSPYKKMTLEEQELIQSKIDSVHNFMIEDIAKNRNITLEDMHEISNGMFYIGKEAIDLKLIDELGNKKTAFNKSLELAGIENARIKDIQTRRSWLSYIIRYTSESWYYLGRGIGSELKIDSSFFNPGIELK